MSDPQKTIFISYRRAPSTYTARAIYQSLRARDYDVFMDVESIDSGKWETIILNQIAARAHFLIILEPGTLDRCKDTNDMLRREINQALTMKRNIIPIFSHLFDFDDIGTYLDGQLADLNDYNSLPLPQHPMYYDAAMDALCSRFLMLPTDGIIIPTPPLEKFIVERKVEAANEQPAPTEEQLSAEEWFRRGKTRDTADYQGKIDDYSKAIFLDPLDAYTFTCRGNAFSGLQNYKAAINDFTKAIHLDPHDAYAYTCRGGIYEKLGNYDAAINDFTEAVRTDPRYTYAYSCRGNTYKKQNNYEAAINNFTEAIRVDPLYAYAYIWRGNIFVDMQNYEVAINDFAEAIHLNPQDVYALTCRGNAYQNLHNYEFALADYDQALSIDPHYGWAQNSRERVLKLME